MSTQPSLATREIEPKQMRLAMAVGDQRRTRIDEISLCHFLETATAIELAERLGREVPADLKASGERGVERALIGLLAGFPRAVSDSIASGFRRRIEALAGALCLASSGAAWHI